MNKLWLISFLFLTGCNLNPLVAGHATIAPETLHGTVLAMGQSNMLGVPGGNPAVGFQSVYPNLRVINCSVGGTSIAQWPIQGQYFLDCLAAVGHDHVIAILWYQGESDAYNGMTDWDLRFTGLVRAWRGLLGPVPVVYAQLATADPAFGWYNTWGLIKSQQASINLDNTAIVITEDLQRRDDVHLTAESGIEVGKRMAKAFLSLKTK